MDRGLPHREGNLSVRRQVLLQPTLMSMRRTAWILWLMLALLPLRGWAVASMALPAAEPPPVHAAMVADAEGLAVASNMPCHQGGEDSPSPACQACDWCHAALALAPSLALPAGPLPAAALLPEPARDTGRSAAGGLDRPPRTGLV